MCAHYNERYLYTLYVFTLASSPTEHFNMCDLLACTFDFDIFKQNGSEGTQGNGNGKMVRWQIGKMVTSI